MWKGDRVCVRNSLDASDGEKISLSRLKTNSGVSGQLDGSPVRKRAELLSYFLAVEYFVFVILLTVTRSVNLRLPSFI